MVSSPFVQATNVYLVSVLSFEVLKGSAATPAPAKEISSFYSG